jgi:hypothetical protein
LASFTPNNSPVPASTKIVLLPISMTYAFTEAWTGDVTSDFAMIVAASDFLVGVTTPRTSNDAAPSLTAMTSTLPSLSR